jgi:hypothetical protein
MSDILEELSHQPLSGGCKTCRLSANKRAEQPFDMERFKLETIHDGEVKVQYPVKSQIRLQLGTTWMMMVMMTWTSLRRLRVLEYKSFSLKWFRLLRTETA